MYQKSIRQAGFQRSPKDRSFYRLWVRLCFFLSLVLIVFFFSVSAFAARPLTTDDTCTVAKGKVQLETGFDLVRQSNLNYTFSPSVVLTYGVLESMDLGIGGRYLFRYPEEDKGVNGLGDLELKLKYRVLNEKEWLPSLAIAGRLVIPTASESKGLGSGKVDFNINVILTRTLSKTVAIDFNVGYTVIGEGGVDNAFNGSVAARFAMSDQWAVVGEVATVNNVNGRRSDDLRSALLGTQYQITPNTIWDAGMEVGRTQGAQYFRLTTGLTLLFQP
jgi:hypothetical protein